ncbi:MAG TPA: tyrosine-type recombinase/integrase, partial [Verrucomicrobiota bacterium]|nr:tyrosine-type recombinase/integrase [Verrucomicrobiota bacterium]
MSSVHRHGPAQRYHCAFFDYARVRRFPSLGVEDAAVARMVCAKIQELHDLAHVGRYDAKRFREEAEALVDTVAAAHGGLVVPAVRRVLEKQLDFLARANGQTRLRQTTAEFLREWLENKRAETGPATAAQYGGMIEGFLRALGARAHRPLAELTARDVNAWRNGLAARLARGTWGNHVKVLRSALATASRLGLWGKNDTPAHQIRVFRGAPNLVRRPFTEAELLRVLVAAPPEWRTAVLAGLYTGQRLGDVAALTWAQVDMKAGELKLRTRKTGRVIVIPLADPLRQHLRTLARGDGRGPIMPGLHGQKTAALSQQFHEVMAAAGLVASRRSHRGRGKGRAAKRELGEISFHSLRRNATSWMKAAGEGEAVVRAIVGHESVEVSQSYTTIPLAVQAGGVAKRPGMGGGRARLAGPGGAPVVLPGSDGA